MRPKRDCGRPMVRRGVFWAKGQRKLSWSMSRAKFLQVSPSFQISGTSRDSSTLYLNSGVFAATTRLPGQPEAVDWYKARVLIVKLGKAPKSRSDEPR